MFRIFDGSRFAPDFPLTVLVMHPQPPVTLHSHTFDELVIITGGRGMHFTDDEGYEIQAGDAFVITRAQAHGYRDTDRLSLVNILYRMEQLPVPARDIRKLPGYHAFFLLEPEYRDRHRFQSHLRLTIEELAEVTGVVTRLREELDGRDPGFELLATAHFMHLVGMLARSYTSHPVSHTRSPLVGIGEVISLLENRYTEDISLETLTDIASMSKSSLLRAFRKAMGTTPVEYLIRLRIRHAAELLCAGMSVTETAYRVGFRDSNYFTRQFRRITGLTPATYRKRSEAQATTPLPASRLPQP